MATVISKHQIVDAFEHLLCPGDDIFVHSALKPMGYFEAGIDMINEVLCETVSYTGTVIMMTDTRSFAQTGRFSIDMPSETGILTEHFRRMPDVKRSCVPMVSFCARGAKADYYTQPYQSHLDETATLSRLIENDAKIMLMGVPYKKTTLYHLAEERMKVPYGFYKKFSGMLIENGVEVRPISQRYFVRKDLSLQKDLTKLGVMLEEDGHVKTHTLGDGLLRVFSAKTLMEYALRALKDDPQVFIAKESLNNI